MIIRRAKIEDFDSILKLQLELEDTECKFDTNLIERCYDTKEGKKRLRKRIKSKTQVFLVAVSNNEVVGFVDGRIMDEAIWYKEKVGILEHICVRKENRRKNVASNLIKAFEREIVNMGAKYIQILAFPENKPAMDLYNKYGYEMYSVYLSKRI